MRERERESKLFFSEKNIYYFVFYTFNMIKILKLKLFKLLQNKNWSGTEINMNMS